MTGFTKRSWGVSLERVQNEFGKNYYEYLLQQSENYVQEHLLVLETIPL